MRVILFLFLFSSLHLFGADDDLVQAVENGDLERCTKLIKQGVYGKDRRKVFEKAIECGQIPCVKLFIKHGLSSSGYSYMDFEHWETAARIGNIPLLESLMVCESLKNLFKIDKGGSLVAIAVDAGHLEVVKWLIGRGASLNAPLHYNDKPIHIAAEKGRNDMVRLLVELGSDVNAAGGLAYGAPLHEAARGGHRSTMNLLMELGADSSMKYMGTTAEAWYQFWCEKQPGYSTKQAKR